jgi:hypothetical protein
MSEFQPDDNFVVQLSDATPTHEAWLSLMRFGLGTLLNNQSLLAEILARESEREAKKMPSHVAGDELPHIMRELGLRIVLDTNTTPGATR